MKARKRGLYTETEAQREAKRETANEYERIFKECADELLVQSISTVMWTLAVNNGWGAGRLRKLADDLHETQDLMNNPSPLHHKFSPLECEQIIKDKYNIDLRAEFKAQVEVKY